VSAVWWFALGGAVWTAVAVVVGIGVGRTARVRDEQVPSQSEPPVEPETVADESDMDVFLSMIRDPSEPYRYRGEQR
jgi:hypothetical protein